VIVCITNDVRDLRPCVVKGKHLVSCDGFQYRWSVDPTVSPSDRDNWSPGGTRIPVMQGGQYRECAGCAPRQAEHGLVCWSCWSKIEDAVAIAGDMITHLRSVERAQQLDNAGVRSASGWVIPVPNTWRTADELLMLLGAPAPGLPVDTTPEQVERFVDDWVHVNPARWVASLSGAEEAVRFALLMQTAMAAHPMREYEHRVRNVKCYKCRQRTLLWKPPLMFEGRVSVVCTNPKCGAELDQTMYERLAVLEEAETGRRRKPAAEEEAS
jgi:hypothetical protein